MEYPVEFWKYLSEADMDICYPGTAVICTHLVK